MKVIIFKQIHSSLSAVPSDDVWMKRECELPFAPAPGLSIRFQYGGSAADYDNVELVDVSWDLRTERFICYTHDDKQLYKLHQDPMLNIQEIVAENEQAGWSRR